MPFETNIASITGLQLPPPVALLLTVAFIVFLFRRDFRENPNVTSALWIPLLWMLIIGSRSVAQWLNLLGFHVGLNSMEEGNPLDAAAYFALIAAGFYVLNKRQVSLAEVVRNNGWLMAFLLYCFIAIFWSDFPFVAFKRWIKILGLPIMALVLFTEPDPQEALTRLMKRSAYVLVPFSILFIKYYPGWGQGWDEWTGQTFYIGVMGDKNLLGWVCMILGFFFFWHLLQTLRSEKSRARRNELLLTAGFICMIWWLLSKASSATSLLSLLIGALTVALLGLRSVNKRSIGVYAVLAVITLIVAQLAFGIFQYVVNLTGHGATIAGRAELWSELSAFHINPIFGAGFESFWLGERLQTLWRAHWWQPIEAHNGYLETYLNLGLVGLLMLIGLLIATFRKIRLEFLRNFQFGRFRLGFLAAVVFFNWTEASFKGLHPIWFVFYIIAMEYPNAQFIPAQESTEANGSRADGELVYADGEACFRNEALESRIE